MLDYFDFLWSISDHIKKFKEIVRNEAYDMEKGRIKKNTYSLFCFTPNYMRGWQPIFDIIKIIPFLGIESLEKSSKQLEHHANLLRNPERMKNWLDFEYSLDSIQHAFEKAREEVVQMFDLLQEDELLRLNEALNCYLLECNYATVVMSVSAVESRLLSLMMAQNLKIKLENMSLGQLIGEYLNNKEEYNNIIPRKHESLLELCNNYRCISVHPKKEKISRPITTSIISMTFAFLLDEDLRAKN
jgi:hypothetical protein